MKRTLGVTDDQNLERLRKTGCIILATDAAIDNSTEIVPENTIARLKKLKAAPPNRPENN